jgi:hypothetical protein
MVRFTGHFGQMTKIKNTQRRLYLAKIAYKKWAILKTSSQQCTARDETSCVTCVLVLVIFYDSRQRNSAKVISHLSFVMTDVMRH